MPEAFLPPAVKPGDTIGIFNPSGPVRDETAFAEGLAILSGLGLQVFSGQPVGNGPEYLAADDDMRILELHQMLVKQEIKSLMAARGGFGCLRIIGRLDQDAILRHPCLIIGFSDLTVLLNALFSQTGMIGLHGPVVSSLHRLSRAGLELFCQHLLGKFPTIEKIPGLEIIRPGHGQGQLIGGNLTTLIHLVGTPWLPDFTGKILLLEDTGEPAYKLDRMLTQLACCNLLDNLSGIILATFDPGHDNPLQSIRLREHVWNRVLELTADRSYPIWGGFPSGHQGEMLSLPIGMHTVMDSMGATLKFYPPPIKQ